MTADQIPKDLGDFEVIRELGRGGMGIVYEARQKSLNRHVALKVLSTSLGLTAKAVRRFQREAEAAAKLHHTNIVPVYSTGEDRGVHFYAMELVDGPSLDQVIRCVRNGRESKSISVPDTSDSMSDASSEILPGWVAETIAFSQQPDKPASSSETPLEQTPNSGITTGSKYFDAVAMMVADTADALEHAHEQGVIHRDIKPSNLLLAPDGRLSINDFGLARVLEQPGMTISGEFVGTPQYMSPEQISAGRAPLDHRTDIYSLGATLYELLTLQSPFRGRTRDEVIAQILHKEPIRPRRLDRRIPTDLETICLKAIERDPDRRYQSASELSDDLKRYVNRHAISARRIGPIGRASKYFRRNPFAAAFVALLLCVVVVAAVDWWRETEQERLAREQARLTRLDDLQNDILEDVLRGNYEGAEDLVREGEDLGASQAWRDFASGQIFLQQSDYEAAKVSFERVLREEPDNVAAEALLAISTAWDGDEINYHQKMSGLRDRDVEGFRDTFYLGYAYCWADPERAVKLLEKANSLRSDRPLVRVFLSFARHFHAMHLVDKLKAKVHIDQAIDDISDTKGILDDTPFVYITFTCVSLAAESIYMKLAEQEDDTATSESLCEQAETFRANALAVRADLERFSIDLQVQTALMRLLMMTGHDRELIDLSRRWRQLEVGSAPAHNLCAGLLRMKHYDEAMYWAQYVNSRVPDGLHSVLPVYVKLANRENPVSRASLRKEAVNNLNRKIRQSNGFIRFDIMQLVLLGDVGELEHFGEDSMHAIIMDGKAYAPHARYFCPPQRRSIESPDQLLAECSQVPMAVGARSHAFYWLALEAISQGRTTDAENHLRACLKEGFFHFHVYWMARALLEHREDWLRWIEEE